MSLPEYALYSDLIAGSGEVPEGRHIVAHRGSGGKRIESHMAQNPAGAARNPELIQDSAILVYCGNRVSPLTGFVFFH